MTPDLGDNIEVESGQSGVEMKSMKNLSEILPEAVASAAAGRPDVFGTNNTAHSSTGSSIAGEIAEV